MVPEIKVSLSFRGSPVASLEPTVAAGDGPRPLIRALQEVAQRTNSLLTEIINSGELSSFTGTTTTAEEEEDESSEDDTSDAPETKKKRT